MRPAPELLEQCRRDDRKAHHELYVMCFPIMYSICSRYYNNKDDRMSALNMIFFKLILNMNDYVKKHNHVPYEQWMRRISINYIIDEFRKQKRYLDLISLREEMPEDLHPYQTEVELKYNKEEIQQAIEQLPPMCKTVFNLHAVDGFKHDEIADMLGISTGTSKAHLFKARKKLQEMLNGVNKSAEWNKTQMQ
jgi:RNA polymerase sigma factor (sigma-70 family)